MFRKQSLGPGKPASTIVIPAFLNALPRWILRLNCGLQRFLRSIISMPLSTTCSTFEERSTWPMPLPYPEIFRAGGAAVAKFHVKKLVCMQVLVFDWLHLGRPVAAPHFLRLGSKLTARQWSVAKMLEYLSFDGNVPNSVDATAMGRAATKFEGFEESLGALSRAVGSMQASFGTYFGSRITGDAEGLDDAPLGCGEVAGEFSLEAEPNAKPLYAERLNFPGAPTFDPLPYFDKSTRQLYEHPLKMGLPLDDVPDPPKVQVRASPQGKIALFRKMAESGLLQPLLPGTYLERHRSGLFAVPKDAARDRMVLDGRPANLADRGQHKWCQGMASGPALAGLCIHPDRALIFSGEDLKDFFYQFVVNDERTARNVLQGNLTLDEARAVFGGAFTPHGEVAIGLSSLATKVRRGICSMFTLELDVAIWCCKGE